MARASSAAAFLPKPSSTSPGNSRPWHTRAAKPVHGIALKSAPSIDFAETVKWKEGIVNQLNSGVAMLLKRADVRVVAGWANFQDGKTCKVATKDGDLTITAEHVILATGSLPIELPFLPFGGPVVSSTEALSLAEVPKRLVVVGAGYIGLELGIAFRKLGSEVTVVEATDHILPLYDAALAKLSPNGWRRAASRSTWRQSQGPRNQQEGPRADRRRERRHRPSSACGQDSGDGRTQTQHGWVGYRKHGDRHGRPVRQGRRPVPYLDA